MRLEFAEDGKTPMATLNRPTVCPSKGDMVDVRGQVFKVDEVQWRLAENRVVVILKRYP